MRVGQAVLRKAQAGSTLVAHGTAQGRGLLLLGLRVVLLAGRPSPTKARCPSGILPGLKLLAMSLPLQNIILSPTPTSVCIMMFTWYRTFSRAFWRKTQALIVFQTLGFFVFVWGGQYWRSCLGAWGGVQEVFLQRWGGSTAPVFPSLQDCLHSHQGKSLQGMCPVRSY